MFPLGLSSCQREEFLSSRRSREGQICFNETRKASCSEQTADIFVLQAPRSQSRASCCDWLSCLDCPPAGHPGEDLIG